jgi:hypothetical protein
MHCKDSLARMHAACCQSTLDDAYLFTRDSVNNPAQPGFNADRCTSGVMSRALCLMTTLLIRLVSQSHLH